MSETNGGSVAGVLLLVLGVAAGVWVLCSLTGAEIEPTSYTGEVGDITLALALDPAQHSLEMSSRFEWTPGKADTLFFLLNKELTFTGAEIEGRGSVKPEWIVGGASKTPWLRRLNGNRNAEASEDDVAALYAIPVEPSARPLTIRIDYRGEIYDEVDVASFSRWEIADETSGLIDERGAFLTPMSGFYPRFPGDDDIHRFHSTIQHPSNWEAIAEGKIVEQTDSTVTFDSEHPIDGTYIIAGPYKVATRNVGGVEAAMYYYEGGEDLTDRYLDATVRYLHRYNEQLGPYAFSRFSTVENWFPTGYGMPTYTLLGSQVLRLPFIIYTSFGHEICHNWWGNGVYVDYESGNWCEGVTTYCADYSYKEDRGPEDARGYRLDVNRDYTEYVAHGDEEDFPLTEFTSRTTAGTRTIGYGKSMMVFHMMRNRIGDKPFWAALRDVYENKKFEKASWGDFFDAFTRHGGEPLGWFREQWVERAGAPALAVSNVSVKQETGKYLIEFDVSQVQEGEKYKLDIPLRLTFSGGSVEESILHMGQTALYHARIECSKRPLALDLDPNMELFRVLDPREASPTLAGFYGAESPVILISDTSPDVLDAYRALADAFNRRGDAMVLLASEATDELLAGRAVLVLGEEVGAQRREVMLAGVDDDADALAMVYAWRDENDPRRVHLSIWGDSPEALAPLGRKLPHYGKYGYLIFTGGENIGKGRWPVTDSPLHVRL